MTLQQFYTVYFAKMIALEHLKPTNMFEHTISMSYTSTSIFFALHFAREYTHFLIDIKRFIEGR